MCAGKEGFRVSMTTNRRGVSATQLARDYGASLNEFANDVVNLLAQLDASEVAATPAERCREACAAVWSAMLAALEASALSQEERTRILPPLFEALLPFWRRHCADEQDIQGLLAARASHYLERRDPASQMKTAASLVNGLMNRLGVARARQGTLGKTLTALFAHRMIGDITRLDDVRSRSGIELPMVATLAALVHVTMNLEWVLRIFRLV
jgi:hypothetical protein